MNTPGEILDYARRHGIRILANAGQLVLEIDYGRLPSDLIEAVRRNKQALLRELGPLPIGDNATGNFADPHDRVWAGLVSRAGQRYAYEVLQSDADPVRMVLAIGGIGTCELLIRRDRWDPFKFMEILAAANEVHH